MGYRNFPHFVLAVRHDTPEGADYILRATIDSDMINRLATAERRPFDDVMIINRKGVLQTPSRLYGEVLDQMPLEIPPYSEQAEITEHADERGDPLVVGSAYVDRSPFAVLVVSRPGELRESWLSLRRELVGFLSISVVLILAVVVWGASWMVKRMREADIKRAAIFHKMEYTNRMAVIGRLAAGVAHEINNPLAVINEKAGLLNDLMSLSETPPSKEKIVSLVRVMLKSVERCSTITHRLLGFAKHMDVKRDNIRIKELLEQVLGFLGKEAHYREIQIEFHIPDDLPAIVSDRGQLQQVFLNIINNAFMALEDRGHLDISAEQRGEEHIAVAIADDGVGIPKENLENIFEPFFTTKPGYGTGLGLSITHGIVEKLGGRIAVESEVGEGTTFTVVLPIDHRQA
jgi:signal transduction histidine kinase